LPLAVHGRPSVVRCLVEDIFLSLGVFPNVEWVLVSEGAEKNGEQSNTSSRFYTKVYQLKLDEKMTRIKVRFRYDRRNNWADVNISLDNMKQLKGLMSRIREEGEQEEVINL
jgi:hypothetical protein